MGYSPPFPIEHTVLFNGDNWYVNGTSGSDTNPGTSPSLAFLTIGAAITAAAVGDRINVFAGTYVENVVLNKNSLELWCEVGTILDGTGTCLTVSANSCRVGGFCDVTVAADQIGMLISGQGNLIDVEAKVLGAANTTGVDITGDLNTIKNVRAANVKATGKCFNINGDKTFLESCVAAGTTTSYGFFVNTGKDIGVIRNCVSSGNQTSGFYVEDSAEQWMFEGCTSGVGDGPRRRGSSVNTWANWHFENLVHADATITTSSGAQARDLFKVTGSILIREITGVVTTVITADVTAVQLVLDDGTATVEITKNDGVLSSMPVGTLLAKTGNVTKTLEIASAAACNIMDEVDSKKESFRAIQKGDGTETLIQMLLTAGDAAQSGVIHWHVKYEQISESSFLEVA